MVGKLDTDPKAPRFRVGDIVRFRHVYYDITAPIIEDRGNLAPGGQRLYRVEFPFAGADEPWQMELPSRELDPAPPGAALGVVRATATA